MSLAKWHEDVEAAAAGVLDASDDARVRDHLKACAECRARYDGLINAARALAGQTEPTAAEHDALLARLTAQLDAAEAVSPQVRAPRRRWLALAAVLGSVVAAGVLFQLNAPVAPPRDVVMRGDDAVDAPRVTFALYARAKTGGAVRLVGEFPLSGEARASAADWLQVKAPWGVVVVARSSDTVVRFEGTASLALTPGRWTLFAGGTVEEAQRLPPLGVLVVDP